MVESEELGAIARRGPRHPGVRLHTGRGAPDHPEACRMVETLIAELAGVSVRERCERGAKPRCCFEVTLAESTVAHE